MDAVWDGDGVADGFADEFESWATRNGGTMAERTDERLRCEFESSDTQMMTGVGVYEANGRHMLRFETVREELELKMLTRFEIGETRLALQSDKGSRMFVFDADAGEWRVEKKPV
ncbi:hypothetical protein [Halobacterium litoreum]|uniref:Uncharacterized protein n=1 Tax=Halobacterium litoreum TaxID=2039234 RepID=A0ABD5NG36_9EURY|nr:hypothetical protein [Halobacterium litoreum]UHH13044.1 hypothetical protein LT972_12880 [Halobacterium litoreum]